MNIWHLWNNIKYHPKPTVLVAREDLPQNVGFHSMYGYDDETAEWIMQNNGVSGLKYQGFKYYADVLFTDFDDDPHSAMQFIDLLRDWGIAHEVYRSGGRSIHVHVMTEPMFDQWVPNSHKEFMLSLEKQFGIKCDISIYQPTAIYRLEGTVHEKTGRPKELIESTDGQLLTIPTVKEEIKKPSTSSPDQHESFWRLMMTTATSKRTEHVFKLTTLGRNAGLDRDEIEQHILAWNDLYCKPKLSVERIERKINENY